MTRSHVQLVAEIGSVHDGSVGNAKRLVSLAAACGADAVKFQTHIVEDEMVRNAPSPSYFTDEERWEYLRRTGFSFEDWAQLREHARAEGMIFLSSPFSESAVNLLEKLGIDGYKVASGEVTNHPMLRLIASTKRPVYLSSGMSNWEELDEAVHCLQGGGPLTVMQATSLYPCPPEKAGLNVLGLMRDRYQTPVGLSDHTLGLTASIAAVVMGATVIERHFAFSRQMYGSDAKHSLEPSEFSILARALDELHALLGNNVSKDDIEEFTEVRRIFQKSIVANHDLQSGRLLQPEDFAYKKPGDGTSPRRVHVFVGRTLKRALYKDDQVTEDDLE